MADRDRSTDELLQELLWAYGPCGQEDAVRAVCARELEPFVDDMWVDDAGNLVGYIAAEAPTDAAARKHRHLSNAAAGPGVATRVMAHMDELTMAVKRVEPDGTLHLTQLGTMYPGNFGLGPVAVLGDHETLTAVLTLGSEHTTKESPRIWDTKPDRGDHSLDWHHVYVFTGCTTEELAAAGVHAGTRVCVHRLKRTLVDAGDFIGSYFMDDRAAVTALLGAARMVREGGRPADDAYLVFTTNEEIGGVGGSYASGSLPGNLTLALEVGPTEREYGTSVTGGPIVGYSDALCVYDKDVADRLMRIATDRGLRPQAATLGAFMSDASHAKANGRTPRAALLCVPTLSTHGYEVIPRRAISDMSGIIVDLLMEPSP